MSEHTIQSAPVPETHPIAGAWLARRLSAEELLLLAKSGFVSGEVLPSGNTCHKLRFRGRDQRQRVVYIGTNTQLAEAIRAQLRRLQSPLRQQRQRRALVIKARAVMRSIKEKLKPALSSRRFYFHGYEPRCRRSESGPRSTGR